MTTSNEEQTIEFPGYVRDGVQGGLTGAQVALLQMDLHSSRVSNRSGGGGRQLSYVESYDIKAMLIRAFGYGGFSAECIDTKVLRMDQDPENHSRWTVTAFCTVRLTIHATGAVYTESAAASQVGGQGIGEVTDFAIKTAESDALKRAATYLGTQFGLSLYRGGSRADVVQQIFEPSQRKAVMEEWERTAEERQAQQAAAQANINRATGVIGSDVPEGQFEQQPEGETP